MYAFLIIQPGGTCCEGRMECLGHAVESVETTEIPPMAERQMVVT
jgi:hypothetical protein